MKKSILAASVVAVAIIIGISVVLVQNNDDVKINDFESSDSFSEKISVTTTTNVITDLVENIGGEHVSVTGLMGPGVDPHLYRPSASDVKELQNACLLYTSPSPRDQRGSRMPSSA